MKPKNASKNPKKPNKKPPKHKSVSKKSKNVTHPTNELNSGAQELKKDGFSNWQKFLKEQAKNSSGTVKAHQGYKKRKKAYDRSASKGSRSNANASEIWFDDVDPIDIEASRFTMLEGTVFRNDPSQPKDDLLQKHDPSEDEPAAQENGTARETKAVALDCEMVGVGLEGQTSILARVSIVNAFGDVLYDEYVKPKERIVDYRTHVSGIRPANLEQGLPLEKVQKDVAKILDKKLLIGHALSNDFKVLMLSHPKKMIRDTAKYKPFKKHAKTAFPSLKKLSQLILQKNIQTGEHSSVEDAKTVMQLYRSTKRDWEAAIKNKHRHVANATTGSNPQATMSGKEKHRLYCARRAIRK